MIVIDQYDIDFKKKEDKDETNIEIFVLDDFYQKHYCTLLNRNIGAQESIHPCSKFYKNIMWT